MIQVIYKALSGDRTPAVYHEGKECCLCGTSEAQEFRKAVFSQKFTDYQSLKNNKKEMCNACSFLLSSNLRNYSWIVDKDRQFQALKRPDLALMQAEPPFYLAITQTGHKHMFYKMPVALNSQIFPVAMESGIIWFRRQSLLPAYEVAKRLYGEGTTKTALRTCRVRNIALEDQVKLLRAVGDIGYNLLIDSLRRDEED